MELTGFEPVDPLVANECQASAVTWEFKSKDLVRSAFLFRTTAVVSGRFWVLMWTFCGLEQVIDAPVYRQKSPLLEGPRSSLDRDLARPSSETSPTKFCLVVPASSLGFVALGDPRHDRASPRPLAAQLSRVATILLSKLPLCSPA